MALPADDNLNYVGLPHECEEKQALVVLYMCAGQRLWHAEMSGRPGTRKKEFIWTEQCRDNIVNSFVNKTYLKIQTQGLQKGNSKHLQQATANGLVHTEANTH